jgi:lysophospholipase L1-like esterase
MTWWQILLTAGILGAVAYRAALVYLRAHAARVQMAEEQRFERLTGDYTKTMLVLGDSTGAGVGASRPEESIAGRLAAKLGATHVENYAASGSYVTDLRAQILKATLDAYDVILIQIGGGDIVFFHNAERVAKELDLAMMGLPDSKLTLLMSAGNVGGAKIFPLLIRPFHTWLTHEYHRWFRKVAKRRGATYVNLYLPRKVDYFLDEPERYFSEDGIHPSSDGYVLWFNKVEEVLNK